jgi:hypothetical protein
MNDNFRAIAYELIKKYELLLIRKMWLQLQSNTPINIFTSNFV